MTLSKAVKEKLKKLGVGIVYLFGSRANNTALETSDYDVGVVFLDPKRAFTNHLFTAVYDALSSEIPEGIDGAKLDISFLQKANAALEMSAISQGVVLFEASPIFRADYEEEVIKRYDDYSPLKREYESATLTALT